MESLTLRKGSDVCVCVLQAVYQHICLYQYNLSPVVSLMFSHNHRSIITSKYSGCQGHFPFTLRMLAALTVVFGVYSGIAQCVCVLV
jgi:hypothetical protein